MKTNEIRELFISYFESKSHQRVESSPLIPGNDPTLLFTNAGMVQFKDVFLGSEQRDYSRAVTAQRCLRAGGKHNDLDNVGYTTRHHTFFEMLGNFSFGDYFKEEAIILAWNFITKELKLNPEDLWVTIFEEDDEAATIWLDHIGLHKDRLVRMGEKSNFWSMGDTGPCGPCSEIFFDHGPDIEGGPPGSADENGDRFVEIWNLVFMQYERQNDGEMKPLPSPSVDTGMGLERVAAVMQGVHSNYDIDLFQNLLSAIKEMSNKGSDSHYQVIADHIRSTAFLIMDGVTPGNEGRGYVLKRIIRRALRHGYELGIESPFFYTLVDTLATEMGSTYPELNKKSDYIKRIIQMEEERFATTLSQGMRLLENEIAALSDNHLSGDFIFKLYDTYGFPVDMTSDIARQHNLEMDLEGFDKAMENQKSMARKASQFSHKDNIELNHKLKSLFLGYEQIEADSMITGVFIDESQDSLNTGQMGQVILEQTPFYAESGGQVGDTGTITTKNGVFEVIDTQASGEAFIHIGSVTKGSIHINEKVQASINPVKRESITKNHTGTHMLHAALMKVLGEHVEQRGSLVDEDKIRFDFSHHQALSNDEIRDIETLVNEKIEENIDVETSIMKHDEAMESGAMALFGEKYGDRVRVLDVGDFSKELCGGTHVKNTNEITLFKVTSESSISSGTRRIEAITGDKALKWAEETEFLVETLTELLQTRREDVEGKVKALIDGNKKMQHEIKDLKAKLTAAHTEDTSIEPEIINGVSLIVKQLDNDTEPEVMRSAIDQYKSSIKSGVIILSSISSKGKVRVSVGVTESLIDKIPANEIASSMSEILGGKGGGRPNFANAGGSQPDNIDKAIDIAKDYIKKQS
jgi:alanyl-tRNA synthetase